jgi:hypothetical protein
VAWHDPAFVLRWESERSRTRRKSKPLPIADCLDHPLFSGIARSATAPANARALAHSRAEAADWLAPREGESLGSRARRLDGEACKSGDDNGRSAFCPPEMLAKDGDEREQLHRVNDRLLQKFIHVPEHRSRLIFDLDSTVVTVFGNQDGAEVGYNPRDRGKRSYNPLLCIEANSSYLWDTELRAGNTGTWDGSVELLDTCFANVPPDIREVRVRADAGFGFHPVFQALEARPAEFGPLAQLLATVLRGVKSHISSVRRNRRGNEFGTGCRSKSGTRPAHRTGVIFFSKRPLLVAAAPASACRTGNSLRSSRST